ncbi:MAG: tyrosine-type recombinase/integrase [Bacteroidales bacterium]|nr:tyrosine-type recombinase/integrase [Bacteroidales bacterium]
MARFNFNLKNTKADKATPINLIVNYSLNRVVFYTGESIPPDFWDKNTQRAKLSKRFPTYPEFNRRLDNIENDAKNIFLRYQNEHENENPSPAEYKRLLEAEFKGTKNQIPVHFIEFTEHLIKQTEKKYSLENKSNTSSYNQTLACIKDFAKDKNKRVDFDTIDSNFYNDFVEYLQTIKKVTNSEGKEVIKYGFKANTIGKHVRNLKHILNEASQPEIAVNKFTFYKSFKESKEEVESIYLNENELQAIYDLDLTANPRLEKVRDLFIVGAWTGLRFSDFSTIQAKNIKGDYLNITTQKTGEKVVIPIHWTVKAIMKKYKDYENSLPPSVSNAKMNDYLKEIGEMLDMFHNKVEISYTKAGKRITRRVYKYELIVTHSARRSFATNMYLAGIPAYSIMKVTGHTTESNFLKYIKVTPDEHAKIMMNYFQKQNKLRVV